MAGNTPPPGEGRGSNEDETSSPGPSSPFDRRIHPVEDVSLHGHGEAKTTDPARSRETPLRQESTGAYIQTLEEAITGGNRQWFRRALARQDKGDATIALFVFMRKFLKTGTRERKWFMGDPGMFMTVVNEMKAYKPEEASQLIGAVNVHDRWRLVEHAVAKPDASVVCEIMDLYPEQGADWIAYERCRDYRYLLLDAVRSGTLRMFFIVLERVGGKDAIVEGETSPLGDGWVLRLLHAALEYGNVEMFDELYGIFESLKVINRDDPNFRRHILDGAVRGLTSDKLQKVFDLFGNEEVSQALRSHPAAFKLLRQAIHSKDIHLVKKVSGIFPKEMDHGRKNRLLEIAARSGDLKIFEIVVNTLSIKEVSSVNGARLVRSAILSGEVAIFDRVADLVLEMELIVRSRGVSFLRSSISSGDVVLVDRVASLLNKDMSRIEETHAKTLLRCASVGGDINLVKYVARMLGATTWDEVTKMDAFIKLECGIRSGNVTLVELVGELEKNSEVNAEMTKKGVSLLEAAVRSGDVALFQGVAVILKDTVLQIRGGKHAVRMLSAAIDSGNEILIDCVIQDLGAVMDEASMEDAIQLINRSSQSGNAVLLYRIEEILGRKVVNAAGQKDGKSLLEAAIRGGNVSITKRVREILGKTAVNAALANHGVSLLATVFHSGEYTLFDQLIQLSGKTVSETTARVKGFQFLASAIRKGDEALFYSAWILVEGQMEEQLRNKRRLADPEYQTLLSTIVKHILDSAIDKMKQYENRSLRTILNERWNNMIAVDSTDFDGRLRDPLAHRDAYDSILGYMVDIMSDMGLFKMDSDQDHERVESFLKRVVLSRNGAMLKYAMEQGKSMLMNDILKLTMWSGDVALVEHAEDCMDNQEACLDMGALGATLLESAVRGGSASIVEWVVTLPSYQSSFFLQSAELGATRRMLLEAAIRNGTVELFDLIAEATKIAEVTMRGQEVALKIHDAVVYLQSAISTGNVALVDRVEQFIGSEVVKAVVEKKGADFLKTAVSDPGAVPVKCVAKLLGHKVHDLVEDKTVLACIWRCALSNKSKAGVFTDLVGILSHREYEPMPLSLENASRKIIQRREGTSLDEILEEALDHALPFMSSLRFEGDALPVVRTASILEIALLMENVEVVRDSLNLLNTTLELKEVVKACSRCFHGVVRAAIDSTGGRTPDDFVHTLCLALQFGAVPRANDLEHLITPNSNYDRWKRCFLDAVCSAPNPFIPGMHILAALDEVIHRLPYGSKKAAHEDLWRIISGVLLEILERLPKSVQACHENSTSCELLLEPETTEASSTGFTGPLGTALLHLGCIKVFCSKPLVSDYISHKFDRKDLPNSEDDMESIMPLEVRLLSAIDEYYMVPKWRMAFDFEVFLAVVVYFSYLVLMQDGEEPGYAERFFILFLLGMMITETREIHRDAQAYCSDRWNAIDCPLVLLLTAGWITRIFDHDSPWGTGLYALGTPLLFGRILHFAQIHPFQGPMIQVITGMTRVLVQFAVVLIVVLFGFATAFYALYHDPWDYDFGDAVLDLFKAMLGDVELFEDIDERKDYIEVATILLVAYLVVMTIMLLNLLIAVLSTAHASVNDNITVEYEVSRARIVRHYVLVVKNDMIPAPLTLLLPPLWLCSRLVGIRYYVFSLPCGSKRDTPFTVADQWYKGAKRAVGIALFWFLFGPVAVALGSLRVVTSLWSYHFANQGWRLSRVSFSSLYRTMALFPVINVVPLTLAWLVGGRRCLIKLVCSSYREFGETASSEGNTPANDYKKVKVMLEKSLKGLNLARLQKSLDDPMNDSVLRPDENRQCAVVEHLKNLRTSMKEAFTAEVGKVERRMITEFDTIGRKQGISNELSMSPLDFCRPGLQRRSGNRRWVQNNGPFA